MGEAESRMNRSETPPASSGKSSSRIREDIDHTRSEMDRTLDALTNRLAPARLATEMLCWMRGGAPSQGDRKSDSAAMARHAGKVAWRQVKKRPISAALIGAGIAWMFVENSNRKQKARIRRHGEAPSMYGGSYVDARTGAPYEDEYGQTYSAEESASRTSAAAEKAGHAWEQARGRASDAAHSAQASAHRVSEEAKQRARQMRNRAQDATSRTTRRAQRRAAAASAYLSDTASTASHYAADTADKARQTLASGYHTSRDRISHAVHEYPLAIGLGALGLGLLAGMAAPRTRHEDQWIGSTSDQLKNQARQAGEEVWERGRHTVQATAEAAADEASKQGLTPAAFAERGREFASKVREDASEQSMTPGSIADKVEAVADRAKQTAQQSAKGETPRGDKADESGQPGS